MTKLRVIFIAGASRSGSTILDRMFGSMPGFNSLGEVHNIWQRGYLENQNCGCGAPFRDCTEWSNAHGARYQEIEQQIGDILALQARVVRNRNIPRMLRKNGSRWDRDRDRYLSLLKELYASVQADSGRSFIVDSSKRAAHGFLLASDPDIDLSVVQLVRDSRAMAHSAMRIKPKSDSGDSAALMARLTPRQSASGWMRQNALCDLLRASNTRATLLRYEDLIHDPASELQALGHKLDLPIDLSWLAGSQADLSIAHTVSGNPIRMHSGPVELKLDEAWRAEMSRKDRRTVTSLTAPGLLRYRYRLST
ncbi:sulfotransferase [Nocardioides sp. AE5]|uniref:sulfotransferase n=1 Tax=Nocardioides sp. AE5 TaxID=2962573 RepID=UPI0028827F2D|nr:sulfotransferase [Nocardioides sp. AE5]MDT0202634.1 sulfotransferase [Nocardioides sp. AE5]